jgi:hypothetical protein
MGRCVQWSRWKIARGIKIDGEWQVFHQLLQTDGCPITGGSERPAVKANRAQETHLIYIVKGGRPRKIFSKTFSK